MVKVFTAMFAGTRRTRREYIRMRIRKFLIASGAMALVGVAVLGQSATASSVDAESAPPTETRVDIPFSAPQSLQDAVMTQSVDGRDVVSYRFENSQIVGEYSARSSISLEEFVLQFERRYGTQPRVVSATVIRQVEASTTEADRRSSALIPATGGSFVAPPADQDKIAALFDERREVSAESRRSQESLACEAQVAAAPDEPWHPEQADVQIYRDTPDTVYFSQFLSWNGVETSTAQLGADDGFESEVNIYTDHPNFQGGSRPVTCPAGYKEQPFAQNYDWNWSAMVNLGSGMTPLAADVNAYADYNDLQDSCDRNSMAIGLRNPQNIPVRSDGRQEILLDIQAPRGVDESGRIGALIQAVNSTGCVVNPFLSLTDCMGTTASAESQRMVLNEDREWVAPAKNWFSFGYGKDVPQEY